MADEKHGATDIVIPDRAVPYILYQRSDLLKFPKRRGARLLLRTLSRHLPLYKLATQIESRSRADDIKRDFVGEMRREYECIAQHLPAACASIVDIGCGVAGIDVFLARHYRKDEPVFYLLDRTQLDGRIFFQYQKERAFYNSLDVAREMLLANAVDDGAVCTLAADDRATIPIQGQVDLVVSLISWGFHFPVATYLNEVTRLLSPSGIVILDVRKTNEDGLLLLEKTFREIEVIVRRSKYVRIRAAVPWRSNDTGSVTPIAAEPTRR